jgi:predicted chitinase
VQEPKQKIKAEAPRVIPATPKPTPTKPATPKPAVPRAEPKAVEPKKITYIFFTDDKNQKITQASYNGMMIRAHFGSTGLIDHKVKMRMYDHEAMGENNFLDETPEFTIKESPCYVRFALNEKVKKRGANLYSDNVFVDIEIMETKAHIVSTQIKVDTNNSIFEIARNITKSKYEKTDAEKKDDKKGECFCNRDITPDELKDMIVAMRKSTSDESGENYYKWNKDNLFTSGHEKFKDKSYDKFSEVLNKTFTKYEINTCIRKIHFIAQCYEETGSFMRSVEGDIKTTYSYDPFRGRGFIQLTHREGYKSFQDVSGYEVIDNPKLVSTDIEIAAMSSGWYWRDNTNKNGNINNWADNDDVWNVSRLVNHPTTTKAKGKINGLQNRIDATNSLKKIFKYPQKCITKKDVKETDCKEDCICKSEVLVTDGFFINPKISIDRVLVLEQDKFTDPLKLDGIILHRTVTKTTSSTISAFKAGRKNKKGKVIYYGTHFIVGKDGVITQTANLNYKTNHCTGWNSKSVGIEVVGMPVDIDGNSTVKDSEIVTWETLTDEQNKSVVCLLKLLLKHYGLSKSNLHCHENEAPKTAGEGKVVLDSITPYL